MTTLMIDGVKVNFFPGTNPNVTNEQLIAEYRKVEKQIEEGDYELLDFDDSNLPEDHPANLKIPGSTKLDGHLPTVKIDLSVTDP